MIAPFDTEWTPAPGEPVLLRLTGEVYVAFRADPPDRNAPWMGSLWHARGPGQIVLRQFSSEPVETRRFDPLSPEDREEWIALVRAMEEP